MLKKINMILFAGLLVFGLSVNAYCDDEEFLDEEYTEEVVEEEPVEEFAHIQLRVVDCAEGICFLVLRQELHGSDVPKVRPNEAFRLSALSFRPRFRFRDVGDVYTESPQHVYAPGGYDTDRNPTRQGRDEVYVGYFASVCTA